MFNSQKVKMRKETGRLVHYLSYLRYKVLFFARFSKKSFNIDQWYIKLLTFFLTTNAIEEISSVNSHTMLRNVFSVEK